MLLFFIITFPSKQLIFSLCILSLTEWKYFFRADLKRQKKEKKKKKKKGEERKKKSDGQEANFSKPPLKVSAIISACKILAKTKAISI